jgi:hypothetical protein
VDELPDGAAANAKGRAKRLIGRFKAGGEQLPAGGVKRLFL